MDLFEINKMTGAFLGVVFFILTVAKISDAIFTNPTPAKEGFAIEANTDSIPQSKPIEQTSQSESITKLLVSADADRGKKIFKKCAACHTVTRDGANRVGPNLWNIVNSAIAKVTGFSYSRALKKFANDKSWDYENLDAFLQSPKKLIKGTAMGFAGVKKAQDRADLIFYINSKGDNPQTIMQNE